MVKDLICIAEVDEEVDEEELETRSSSTGTISSTRWRAARRRRCVGVKGVVDDEEASRAACFCLMRSKREDLRASGVAFAFVMVGAAAAAGALLSFSLFEEGDDSVGRLMVERLQRAWALMAPALRSSSLRWPFKRRGARTVDDVQGVIGRRGSEFMKASTEEREPEAGFEVVVNVFHCLWRFVAKVALNNSSFKSRFCGVRSCSERVDISMQIFEWP